MKQPFILLAGCLLLWGCASTQLPPVTTVTTTQGFSFEEDEKRLWNRSEEEQKRLNQSGLLYKDDALEAYLNSVARKLQPEEVYVQIPFQVKVLRSPYLNAFAFPNGIVYVHTGLIARMDNEAQLAALLAHEMTHATHRHTVKGFRDVKNKSAFLATLQATVGGFSYGLAGMLGALGTVASVTGYSRDLETEADMEGIKAVVAAGYDPSEAPKLFDQLKKDLEEEKRKEPFFFGTHPRLEERVTNYQIFLMKEGNKGGATNTEVFLSTTRDLVWDNAWLDLRAGRFRIARIAAEKYIAIVPDDARGYALLGEVLRQKGEKEDMERAKESFMKAIDLDPSYPEPSRGLGLIYYKEGEKDLAREYLDQYLFLAPDASERGFIAEYMKILQ
jgi:beta-barrel assembly-enhancing protease